MTSRSALLCYIPMATGLAFGALVTLVPEVLCLAGYFTPALGVVFSWGREILDTLQALLLSGFSDLHEAASSTFARDPAIKMVAASVATLGTLWSLLCMARSSFQACRGKSDAAAQFDDRQPDVTVTTAYRKYEQKAIKRASNKFLLLSAAPLLCLSFCVYGAAFSTLIGGSLAFSAISLSAMVACVVGCLAFIAFDYVLMVISRLVLRHSACHTAGSSAVAAGQ